MFNAIPQFFLLAIKKIKSFCFRLIINGLNKKDEVNYFIQLLLRKSEKISNSYTTYHQRPISTNSLNTYSDNFKKIPLTAIVIQGPIVFENDFTKNTIDLYRKHFKQAIIILSTWEDQNIPEAFYDNDFIHLILNKKPANAGIGNINYQIVSSLSGILKAKQLGAKYVMKTRTDQRMYAPNIEEYLLNLLDVFPPVNKEIQQARLIALSFNTFKYRLYSVSDMMIFGEISDMLNFWECTLDSRHTITVDPKNIMSFSKERICEVYLVTNYLDKLGVDWSWDINKSLELISKLFIIIDKETIDLFWPKYSVLENRWLSYDAIRTSQELYFRDWLILNSTNSIDGFEIDSTLNFTDIILSNRKNQLLS
ncbi:MAG: WavE lipopolysaccharide synthesis family protein [Sediminibacterium sp.]|nr:WavE lipopolysaccharide synthesis family protein [Sediminibacterium sp.]